MRLQNKVAIITGAGSGIGQASAIRFAEEGAKITLAGRRLDKLQETAQMIIEQGNQALCVPTDVRSEEQIIRMIDYTLDQFGQIDILFNCAGVGYCSPYVMGATVDTPSEDWDQIININLRSMFYTCKHVLPIMKRQGKGAILNCSSINGVIGCGADVYSASKGGVLAYSRALAVENAKYNIRVNVVSPAATDTPMIQGAYDTIDGFYDYWSKAAPIQRMGEAIDVANAALFLVSDEASYITGQNLMVDGGLSIS